MVRQPARLMTRKTSMMMISGRPIVRVIAARLRSALAATTALTEGVRFHRTSAKAEVTSSRK